MRILYWFLGAGAAAAAGVYLADQRSKRSTVARFRRALEADKVTIDSARPPPAIVGPGEREEYFHGIADDVRFLFTARTDVLGIRWIFSLTWIGEAVTERWTRIAGDRERSLSSIYLTLKRLAVHDTHAN